MPISDDRSAYADHIRAASTGQLSDAMDRLGLPRGGCRSILPVNVGDRLAGPAFTVLFGRIVDQSPLHDYLKGTPSGSVVVLAAGGSAECAVWGGRRSTTAAARGAVGTVIDGAVRDVEEHAAARYPVFACGRSPLRSNGVIGPVATELPVAFAGTAVFPGDWIVGDESGLMVLPREQLLPIAETVAGIVAGERTTPPPRYES